MKVTHKNTKYVSARTSFGESNITQTIPTETGSKKASRIAKKEGAQICANFTLSQYHRRNKFYVNIEAERPLCLAWVYFLDW